MRFHCPQCDTKYRIAEDKLAAKPTAKMRCKECATVFSLQEAIAAAALRSSEVSTPALEGEQQALPAAVILPSAPPPRVPLPTRPSRPPSVAGLAGTPARSALQTRPLASRTSDRPPAVPGAMSGGLRGVHSPTRPLGTPGTLPLPRATSPQLTANPTKAPLGTPGAAATDPPVGQRPGRLSPTVSVGLPPRDAPAELSRSQSVSPASGDESGAPVGPVLGRGSAAGFPPVTAERTLPAVPPFHPRAPAVYNRQDSAESSNQTSSLLEFAGARSVSASSLSPAQSNGPAQESDVVPTPRFEELHVVTDVPDPFSSGPWSSNVNAAALHASASETRESAAAFTGGSLGSRPPDATAAQAATASSVDVHSTKSVSFDPETPRRKAGVSMAVAGLVAVLFGAGGFGFGYVTGASSQGETAQVVPAAPAIQPDARRPGTLPPPPPPPEASHEPVVDLPETAVAEPRQNERRTRKSNERASEEPTESVGLQGEQGSDSLSGLAAGVGPVPAAGPGSERGTTTGLEAAAIQSTVQKNQNAVKRSCWQPALNGRSADAPSTARVTTTIQIAPNGAVTNVKHSGDPRGYPGLGGCIVTRVKTWTFPRANGSTTANIPFVFAAQ